MSEFLAEARVVVKPDTAAFATDLRNQLARIKVAPFAVPIVASATGLAGVAAATAGLSSAQKVATQTTRDLDTANRLVNTTSGKGAVLLDSVTDKMERQKGAGDVLDKTLNRNKASLLGAGTAAARLDAGLLGLRTAVGSAAVIGLGALSLAAIAAGKALRGMVLITAQFEQELNTFQSVADATSTQMEAVSEAALKLGADVSLPAVSAADAAVAMTELARAGLSVEDALAGAEGVLQLATAAQISNEEASRIAANALNAFGLAGDQATRVADDLANAANAAQGSISDFGLAFQQSSAVARQVGLSLEDTTALLSLLAKNGLRGSDAGTSLRVSLIKLIAPTAKAQKVISDLGISIRDAQGNVRPDVFAQFAEATADLAPNLRDAAAAAVFGTDGLRALSIAGREGAEGLRLMQFEIDQQGTAAEVAAARTKGLAGEAQGLSSNMQTLGINIGQVTNPILTGFAAGLSDAIGGANRLAGAIGGLGSKVEEKAGPDSGFGRFIEDISAGVADLTENTGIFRFRDAFRDATTGIGEGGLSAAQKLRALNKEMQALQTARIAVQKGGLSDVADQFTGDIERIRSRIAALTGDTAAIGPAIAGPLRSALEVLGQARAAQLVLGKDTTKLDAAIIHIAATLQDYTRAAQLGVLATNSVASGFEQVDRNARGAAFSVGALSTQVANLTRESAALGDELLKIQSEGGAPGQQIAVLQQDIQAQRDLIAEAKAGPAEGRATAIRAAREKIISDQNKIESLQGEIDSAADKIVADAKAAAAKAKTAAKEAQDARDKQFEALADLFGGRQKNIENQIERAGIKDNIQKQINLNKALIASLSKERKALIERLKTLKVSNEVRKKILEAITAAIEDAQQDILRLQQDQADKIKEFSTPKIDLRIRIAQARDNVLAEIKLRRQRLALITTELVKLKNAGKKNTIAWLDLKAQQAEEIAAINDLEDKTKEKNNAFGELAFQFLQTQQGFAANLLGNLLDPGATAGILGGTASPSGGGPSAIPAINLTSGIDPATGRPFRESGGPGDGLARQATEKDIAPSGPTKGGQATEVDLLRQIRDLLRDLKRGTGHPEAQYNKVTTKAALEYQGGV